MRLQPGADLGPYKIVEQVGQGGMATVYKAYQAALTRFVAIKVLPQHLAGEGDFQVRFRDEAVRLAALRHPSIPAVFDYGTVGDISYIASDFIDGGTLSDQLGRPLPLEYTVQVLTPIASALDYAHSRGVVHRDIKPSNILLSRDGTPMLSDFGIARMLAPDHAVTQTGMILGTPQYMAPEQGAGETGPEADIYSLGVVAYHMLTGRVPFDAATPMAVILAHQQDPLPLPRSVNPAISPGVEAVLLKALSRDPADRFTTAAAMVRALGAADTGRADTTVPITPAPAAAPPSRRGRWPFVAAGAALLVVIAVGAAYALSRTPRSTPAAVTTRHPARWQQWVHLPGILDVSGPRTDGRLLAAANGKLALVARDGSFGAYSGAYQSDPGSEAYIVVSPGLTMTAPACTFAADDTFALHLAAPLGVTRIDPQGHLSSLATLTGADSLNGIVFDTTGRFGHRLLVTGSHSGVTILYAVDCQGHATTITSQAPRVEGGLAVAPTGFGAYAGDLVGPDEIDGKVIAIAPDGSASTVVLSGLPTGQDVGVESAGFVPAGFTERGGFAYVADRATAKNAHPGTDSILRLSAADLAAAGVADGDLLVVTEGGSLTISVRCGTTCGVLKVASGPDVAHGEGRVAFTGP